MNELIKLYVDAILEKREIIVTGKELQYYYDKAQKIHKNEMILQELEND